MFIVLSLSFLIGFVFLYDYIRKSSDRWKKLSQFPGDATLPVLGNGLQLGFDADEAPQKLMNIWKRLGKQTFRFSSGFEDWVLLSDPDDVGILLNHPTELSKPAERNAAMIPLFGNSVSSSEGEKWKSMRKLMTPSFHFKTLDSKVVDVNKHCDHLLAILDTHDGNDPVNLYRYIGPYMFDLLCGTLMGVECNYLDDPDNLYIKASLKALNIMTKTFFSYWRNIRALSILTPVYWEMVRTFDNVKLTSTHILNERRKKINQIRDEAQNNNNDVDLETLIEKKLSYGGCLLDKLLLSTLPNGDPTPDEFIKDEITLVCYTGHYTTSKTISHTLYCLAKYPEIQNKVIEEQKSIFTDDFHKKPTNQELTQMKYLEAVIKETMRFLPTLTKIGRQLHNDLTLTDGRVVPAGATVIVFYEALYKNPKVFPEPEKYKPERHLEPMHTFSLVPFSAGPRNCIGFRYAWVAMKATLSNILRRYEVIPGGPGTEPQFVHRIATESKNGIQIMLRKRKL